MKYTVVAVLLFILSLGGVQKSVAQDGVEREVSSGKAFALSLVLPGLGHRYVQGGDWGGWATVFALADAAIWGSLAGSEYRRDHLVDNYTTLAATRAGADVEGKSRNFFLNLASYATSEEYLSTQLRNRSWSDIESIADPANQWAWSTEEDFQRYRGLREDAESLRRRRSYLITTLVANRLISGFAALRGARSGATAAISYSLSTPPAGSHAPMLNLRWRW